MTAIQQAEEERRRGEKEVGEGREVMGRRGMGGWESERRTEGKREKISGREKGGRRERMGRKKEGRRKGSNRKEREE